MAVHLSDMALGLAFVTFVAIEFFLGEGDQAFLWQTRLIWVLTFAVIALVAYQQDIKRVTEVQSVRVKAAPKLVEEVKNERKPADQPPIVAPVEVQSDPLPTTPALVESAPTEPNSILSMTSISSIGDQSILSNATASEGSTKKKRGNVFKRTAKKLFSPLKLSSRSKRNSLNGAGQLSASVPAERDGASAIADVSVLSAPTPTPTNVEQSSPTIQPPKSQVNTIETPQKEVAAVISSNDVSNSDITPTRPAGPDEFGFGPEAPRPFTYTIPNTWGYLGYLTDEQKEVLEKMRAKNYSCIESREPNPKFLINDETLLRFLRARKFDLDKACKMFEAHLAWRDKYLPTKLTPDDIATVLGMGVSRFGPYSKTGLPVTMIKVEWFDPAKFEGDVDLFIKYVAFFFERGIKRLPKGGDKGMLFFDMRGWSLRKHATRFALKLTAELINIIQAHNPERLEKCVLFNTPFIFSGTWALIKGWLDPVVAAKIMFVSDTAIMAELFDLEHLPKEYGGNRELPYPIEGFSELHKPVLTVPSPATPT